MSQAQAAPAVLGLAQVHLAVAVHLVAVVMVLAVAVHLVVLVLELAVVLHRVPVVTE